MAKRKIFSVQYNPTLDVYYVPSKSRGDKIPRWPVYESRTKTNSNLEPLWICDCEDWNLNKKQGTLGDCRHAQIGRFYKYNKWAWKYLEIIVDC